MSTTLLSEQATYSPQRLRPPLKVHGGKFYLARQIIQTLPQRRHFCEPFAGGASVLLNLNPDRWGRRVLSDLNPKRVNLFLMIRDRCDELIKKLAGIEYTEANFKESTARDRQRPDGNPIEPGDAMHAAIDYFVRMRMSRGGLGTAFAWSDRLRGGQPGDVNAWETIREGRDGLPAISRRLAGVEILNRDAIEVLAEYGNDPQWLFYLDPPYLHSTRTATTSYGIFEMNEDEHRRLATVANASTAAIALSGYESHQYRQWCADWSRATWSMPNHSAQHGKKQRRQEILWLNKHRW